VQTADQPGPATSVRAGHGVKVEETVTIQRSPQELYRYWRDLENLPRFMRHLESVKATGPNRSHWVAKGPLGMQAEWDAEVYTEREGELIGWRSLEGSEVDTAGSVHVRRLSHGGTEVRVVLKYDPPAGKLGAAVARLLGQAPEQQIREDLQHFKQLMESGGSPAAVGMSAHRVG
jgi:uncharacterized membrane protein